MAGTPKILGEFSHSFEYGDIRLVMRAYAGIDGSITLLDVQPPDHGVPAEAIEAEREELENLRRGVAAMRSLA